MLVWHHRCAAPLVFPASLTAHVSAACSWSPGQLVWLNKAALQARDNFNAERVAQLETPFTAQEVLDILDNKIKNERCGECSN